MYTTITYIFEKDGVKGMACGYKPKNVTILEERVILHAEDGYTLYKGEEEVGGAVWLITGDTIDNYHEVELPPEPEPEEEPEENLDGVNLHKA